MLYFIIVAASGFGLSLIAPTQVRAFAASARRNGSSVRGVLSIGFIIAAILGIIVRFSPVHKFMLADNRHYTFYIWRKFFLKHDLAKFLPTPLYLYLGWRCWDELGKAELFGQFVCVVRIRKTTDNLFVHRADALTAMGARFCARDVLGPDSIPACRVRFQMCSMNRIYLTQIVPGRGTFAFPS